jgi:hypothetical protein
MAECLIAYGLNFSLKCLGQFAHYKQAAQQQTDQFKVYTLVGHILTQRLIALFGITAQRGNEPMA